MQFLHAQKFYSLPIVLKMILWICKVLTSFCHNENVHSKNMTSHYLKFSEIDQKIL
jgi:hypothetical protein